MVGEHAGWTALGYRAALFCGGWAHKTGCHSLTSFSVPFVFKHILLIMVLQFSHFLLLFIPLHPVSLLPPAFPHLSSCPSVVHTSCFASPYPILFLTSPCLFDAYQLCFLFSVLFPQSPLTFAADNSPCDLHFCDSVPVLVVYLVCFCFCFRCGC